MLVDTNGEGSLADEIAQTVVSPPGALWAAVKSDASGAIDGRGAVTSTDEVNWGGWQVVELNATPTLQSSWGSIQRLDR